MKTRYPKIPGGSPPRAPTPEPRRESSAEPGTTSTEHSAPGPTASALDAHRAELEEKRAATARELEAWRSEERGFTSMSRVGRAARALVGGEHPLQEFARQASEPEAAGPSPLRLQLRALQERVDLTDAARARVAEGEAPLAPEEVGTDLVLDEIALAVDRPLSRADLVAHRSAFLVRAVDSGRLEDALESYSALAALYLATLNEVDEGVHQVADRPSLTSVVNGWVLSGRLRTRGSLILTAADLERHRGRILKVARRLAKEGRLPDEAPPVTAESLTSEVERLRALEHSPAQHQLLEAGVRRGHQAMQRATRGQRLSRFGRGALRMLDDPSTWAMVLVGALAGSFGRLSMAAAKSAAVAPGQVVAAKEANLLAGVTAKRFLATRAAEGVGFHLGMNAFEHARHKGERATWGLADFARSVALFEVLGGVQIWQHARHIETAALRHAAALGEETLGLSLLGLGEVWLRGGDAQDALELVEHNLQFLLAMRLLSGARWAKRGFAPEPSQAIAAKRAEFAREFKRSRRPGLPVEEQAAAARRGCRAFFEYASRVTEEVEALRRDESVDPEEPIRFRHRGVESTAEGVRQVARIMGATPELANRAARGGGVYSPLMPVPVVDGAKAAERPGLLTHEYAHRKFWSLDCAAQVRVVKALTQADGFEAFLRDPAFAGATSAAEVAEDVVAGAAAGELRAEQQQRFDAILDTRRGGGTVRDLFAEVDLLVTAENRAAWTARAARLPAPMRLATPRAAFERTGYLERTRGLLERYPYDPLKSKMLFDQLQGEGFEIRENRLILARQQHNRLAEVEQPGDEGPPPGRRYYWKVALGTEAGEIPIIVETVDSFDHMITSANDFVSAAVPAASDGARDVPLMYRQEGDHYRVVVPRRARVSADPDVDYNVYEVARSLSELFADLQGRPPPSAERRPSPPFYEKGRDQLQLQRFETRLLDWSLGQIRQYLPELGMGAITQKARGLEVTLTSDDGELTVDVCVDNEVCAHQALRVLHGGKRSAQIWLGEREPGSGDPRSRYAVLKDLSVALRRLQAMYGGPPAGEERPGAAGGGVVEAAGDGAVEAAGGGVVVAAGGGVVVAAGDGDQRGGKIVRALEATREGRSEPGRLPPSSEQPYQEFRDAFNDGSPEDCPYLSIVVPRLGRLPAVWVDKTTDSITVNLYVEGKAEPFEISGDNLLKVRSSSFARARLEKLANEPQLYRPPALDREVFDPERFIKSLREIVGKKGRTEVALQMILRRQVRALLDSYGLCSLDVAAQRPGRDLANVQTVISNGGVVGEHSWDGEAGYVKSHVLKTAAMMRYLYTPKANRSLWFHAFLLDDHVDAFLTLLHEELHGYSKIERGAFADFGQILEEALTEVACRHVGRLELARHGIAAKRTNLPNKGARPRWSYDERIQLVLGCMEDVTGWSWDACCRELGRVAMQLNGREVKVATTPVELLNNFALRIEGIDPGQYAMLVNLVRARGRELANRSD